MKPSAYILAALAFITLFGCGRGSGDVQTTPEDVKTNPESEIVQTKPEPENVKTRLNEARTKIKVEAKARIKGEAKTEPIVVRVLSAGGDERVSTSTYVGTVEAGKTAIVSTNNPGTLGSFTLKRGDHVRAGQVIAKVESQSIRSVYEASKSTLDQALDGYERLKKVYASGSVAEVKMVEMETNLAKAQAAFDAAQKSLWHCTVTAPFSGTVGEVYATEGSEVALAAPLVQLIDTHSSEIHFPVPEVEFASVKVGDKALVEIPALGKTITASVSSKGVVASQLSHSYDCTIGGVDKEKELMPGMVCKVRLYRDSKVATVIPASAVMTDTRGRYVWTVDADGVVGKEYIKVGGYSGDGIVVDEGLGDGIRVIIEGSRKVSTGMHVTARE